MKKLFKNSFFSFLKNKVAIVLLMVIIFLTTASFTMFNSATNSFQGSYNQVMSSGNRHDYTIKELYSVDGHAKFTNAVKDPDISTKIPTFTEKKTSSNSFVRYNNEDLFMMKLTLVKKGLFSNTEYVNTWVGFKVNDIKNLVSGITNQQINGRVFEGTSSNYLSNITIDWSKKPKEKKFLINKNTKFKTALFDTGFFGSNYIIKEFDNYANTKIAIEQFLITHFNKKENFRYTFKFAPSASTGSYKSLNVKTYEFWSDNYDTIEAQYKKEQQIIQAGKTPSTHTKLTSANVAKVSSTFNGVNTLGELQKNITDELTIEAKKISHDNLVADINALGNVDLKNVESVAISSGSKIFKFVKEQRSNVDIMKIYKGNKLPEATYTKNNYVQKFRNDLQENWRLQNEYLDKKIKELSNSTLKNASSLKEELKTHKDEIKAYQTEYKNIQDYQIHFNDWSSTFTSSKKTFRTIDPTSYASIISPTYATRNKIKAMGLNEFNSIIKSDEFKIITSSDFVSFNEIKQRITSILKRKNLEDSVIWTSGTFFFVTGIGITPDFVYPVISESNPIPNTETQAIVYANKSGYHKMMDSNPGSQTENYIAIKIHGDEATKKATLDKITQLANDATSWPTNINAVSSFDSDNENVILAPIRITFLEKLNNSITIISYIVTTLLIAFTAFIVVLVVKKQIENRKKQLGILLANGYSKLEIAASMMIVGLIVAAIPAFFGYLLGHFMQFALMNIFSNYWTLPIWHTQFSWITLLITFVSPIIGISTIAFIISLIALRGSIPEILSGARQSRNIISRYIATPLWFLGIKTKITFSLVASNISKLIVAFVAFSATIIALSISFNTVGKFNYALNKSRDAITYEYQVDLETPTVEAGLYSAKTLDEIFFETNGTNGVHKPVDYRDYTALKNKVITDYTKLDYSIIKVNPFGGNGLIHTDPGLEQGKVIAHSENSILTHLATAADSWYATAASIVPSFMEKHSFFPKDDKEIIPDPFFLKNRIQLKSLLDIDMQDGLNPWTIASKTMPDNQKNNAEEKSYKFIQWTANKMDNDPKTHAEFQKLISNDLIRKNLDGSYGINKNKIHGGMLKTYKVKEAYRNFISYGLSKSIIDYVDNKKYDTPIPYLMSYNNVLVNKTDELYTHVDINYSNGSKNKQISIRGLNVNKLEKGTSMIKMSQPSIQALKSYKQKANEVPIVINKFFQEYYDIDMGSNISGKMLNATDRFIKNKNLDATFKVVGIEETFDSNKVYTLQSYANKVLGLDKVKKNLQKGAPFNGVLTSHKNPLIFNTQSMYSVSGIYTPKNNINISDKNEDGYISIYQGLFDPTKTVQKWSFGNSNITDMGKLFNQYGNGKSFTPMNAVYKKVTWSKISEYQFISIMDLSSAMMNTVQSIAIFIALAFVLLISTMIIADNKQFIATMKVMGYRSQEISKIFFMTFVPSLLIALIVAIPISFGVQEAIRESIMGFGHVLIPLYLVGWEILAALVVLVLGFIIMYWISARKLKNTSLLSAFDS